MSPLAVLCIVSGVCALVILLGAAYRLRRPTATGSIWRYCPWCAASLVEGVVDGKQRLKCSRCAFVNWDNPRPVAVVLIPTATGGLVLIKRKIPPRAGMFALPGGFVEPYELPEAGAVREAREETGLEIEIDHLISMFAPPNVNQILFFYLAKPTAALPRAGDDASEATVFARNAIPAEIAFPSHQQVIEDWLRTTR